MKTEFTENQVNSMLLSISFEQRTRKSQLKDCENRGYYLDKQEEINYVKNRLKHLEELKNYILH